MHTHLIPSKLPKQTKLTPTPRIHEKNCCHSMYDPVDMLSCHFILSIHKDWILVHHIRRC